MENIQTDVKGEMDLLSLFRLRPRLSLIMDSNEIVYVIFTNGYAE